MIATRDEHEITDHLGPDLCRPDQPPDPDGVATRMLSTPTNAGTIVTGEGLGALVAELTDRMPPGPRYFPDDEVSDLPEERWVAELVREQLLAVTRDELPYSIATQVTEWEWPRIRVDIVVERDSQKGMVIGKGGQILKQVGERARAQLPEGVYLELRVKVDKDWQRRPERVERLGY
jgi:GTP-binding protein Era